MVYGKQYTNTARERISKRGTNKALYQATTNNHNINNNDVKEKEECYVSLGLKHHVLSTFIIWKQKQRKKKYGRKQKSQQQFMNNGNITYKATTKRINNNKNNLWTFIFWYNVLSTTLNTFSHTLSLPLSSTLYLSLSLCYWCLFKCIGLSISWFQK